MPRDVSYNARYAIQNMCGFQASYSGTLRVFRTRSLLNGSGLQVSITGDI